MLLERPQQFRRSVEISLMGIEAQFGRSYAPLEWLADFLRNWTPTPQNLEALPLGIKRYIDNLEIQADPQGMVRENVLLREENKFLRMECERLAAKNETPRSQV